MERKKRSKCNGWECCYANKIFGTFGVEMRACGQKLVKFCAHTHTHAAKLVVEMIHQSWIHLSLDGHLRDHQVHIGQCHYQVKLQLPLQIYLVDQLQLQQ